MKNLAIMNNRLNIFQTVTDKIIQKLEQGVILWTNGLTSKTTRFPTNFITIGPTGALTFLCSGWMILNPHTMPPINKLMIPVVT